MAQTPDESQLRISDDDRHQVAEILREAAGAGRIDLGELDERLEATYQARTYADLVPITLDLPADPAHPVTRQPARAVAGEPQVVAGNARENNVAIMGAVERKGNWVVPEQFTVFCMMGGADLDLRQARFSAREVVITVNAFMGGADIKVNPHTRVVVEGVGIMGAFTGPGGRVPDESDESSPILRVRGVAIMGGVTVSRKPAPGVNARRALRG